MEQHYTERMALMQHTLSPPKMRISAPAANVGRPRTRSRDKLCRPEPLASLPRSMHCSSLMRSAFQARHHHSYLTTMLLQVRIESSLMQRALFACLSMPASADQATCL